MKPYSESCERNQRPILKVLQETLTNQQHVLEIASGTGQHAVYFGRALPHLSWQTSELTQNHEGILAWLNEIKLPNVLPPITINVNDAKWPVEIVDTVFNANTVHIITWPEVERLFAGIARVLNPSGILCLYGPFKYKGEFTSESNACFDALLKSRNRNSGIRDFETINRLAETHDLLLVKDVAMPNYNQTLVWQRAPRILKTP
ncbi:class I SAM-dependent methyltransferase [Nitrosomonadaceae bacterium]|nr:class I SAM-dependent methyltransferase [Nitrosomonadaceae bacterium]